MSQISEAPTTEIVYTTRNKFLDQFGSEPIVFRSPGRVNLIGEHTDYNEGFVLPAAIDKSVCIAIQKRDDRIVRLHAGEFNQSFEGSLDELKPLTINRWANYVLGVANQIQERGHKIEGFDAVIDGNVPMGSGMSSSAALECATAYALNELFNLNIEKQELVQIAQKAEHTFAGVQCGIMDQFASMFGSRDQLIRLDCRSLDYEYVPIEMEGYKLVLFNTNVKHSLSSSAYNQRRQECAEGVRLIQEKYPQVKSLRDATVAMVDELVKPVNETAWRRCRYVVLENNRVLEGCEDLKSGDLASFGEKMFETHYGLSQDYEVSCSELDFLVDAVKDNPDVLGARMMGGGFGGCTINLVKEEAIESLAATLSEAYPKATGLELSVYICQTDNGTSLANA